MHKIALCLLFVICPALPELQAEEGSPSDTFSKAAKLSAEFEKKLPQAKDLSLTECLDLGATMEQTIQEGKLKTFNQDCFDWHTCFDLSTQGLDVAPEYLIGMKVGFIITINKDQSFVGSIRSVIQQGGKYTLLRVRERAGKKSLLFRLILPNHSVNYHEYFLTKDRAGKVKAYDFYIYLSGERMSEHLQHNFLTGAALDKSRKADGKNEELDAFLKQLNEKQRFSELVQNQKGTKALEMYDAFPANVQKEKNMLLLASQAALHAKNADRYEGLIKSFRKSFPSDPTIDFNSIDYYALRNDFKKAMESVERVDKAVGGDPFLEFSRAGIYLLAGDQKKAKAAQINAIEREPKLQELLGGKE